MNRPRRAGSERSRRAEALLLDEMFSPALAAALTQEGFDVLPVATHAVLAGAPDEQVAMWARREDRRLVTENVCDFAPLVGTGTPPLRVLFTSSRRFPRQRRNPGPLLVAVRSWLMDTADHGVEHWLR
ncbi:MAG: DUF5615 family PIN-like protein [Phycicoccus sp.]